MTRLFPSRAGSTLWGRLFSGATAEATPPDATPPDATPPEAPVPSEAPAPPAAPAHECVICRSLVASWIPYVPEGGRSPFLVALDAIGSNIERFACPNCHSIDRERHLLLFFDKLNLWSDVENKSVLHFAPERLFATAVAAARPTLHVKGDLFPANEDVMKIDLLNIPFADGFFDLVVCNHVLEHVDNVEAALAEVRRILKPGGRFVCQTPYAAKLSQTFEDPLLQSPEDRRFFYGQDDHVRLFGRDIELRIQQGGFTGRMVSHDEMLGDVDPVKLGVNEREPFFDFRRS